MRWRSEQEATGCVNESGSRGSKVMVSFGMSLFAGLDSRAGFSQVRQTAPALELQHGQLLRAARRLVRLQGGFGDGQIQEWKLARVGQNVRIAEQQHDVMSGQPPPVQVKLPCTVVN